MDFFDRREDIYRSVTLTVDGSAVDTAIFNTIVVTIRHRYTKETLDKLTLAAGEVKTPDPTSSGIITFIIPRTSSYSAKAGTYEYEITTDETDSDYTDSKRYRKFVGNCFYLTDGFIT